MAPVAPPVDPSLSQQSNTGTDLVSLSLPPISISQPYSSLDEGHADRAGVTSKVDADCPQRLPLPIELGCFLDLTGVQGRIATRSLRAVEVFEEGGAVDLEPRCEVVDALSGSVGRHQFRHLGRL